uniref:FtsX-like permease family protein n=1 Tax=Nonomuraea pusilla TaxID=46177 RepID=UPI0006E42A99|nr:FtsX-like permease family protein [Nonomuraea pusilla]
MSAVRAALRLSWRDMLRAKGRSALIMIMVGLPVLAVTALFTLNATTEVTMREQLTSRLGEVADARIVTFPKGKVLEQDFAGNSAIEKDAGPLAMQPWPPGDVAALVKGRLIPYDMGTVSVLLPEGHDWADSLLLDLRDPLARGVRRLVEGRFPAAPGEVAVTPALVDAGVRVGGTIGVTRRDAPARVVGVMEHPTRPGIREVAALPGATLEEDGEESGVGWLAETPAPLSLADVARLNRQGLLVASRAVIEDEPRPDYGYGLSFDEGASWAAVGAVLIVTETALLAGPAFAVGLRRRGRELALIAAQGGSAAHLRLVVLADGLLLGGVAAALGTAGGIGVGLLAESIAARTLDWQSGPPEIPWPQVLGVALLGLVSALAAALVPAVSAARQDPVQVLAGRSAEARGRPARPLPGLVLAVLGLGAVALAAWKGDVAATVASIRLSVVASSIPLVFGLVALMPWLVQITGRWAARLPLPLRLSVRDAGRHRTRTASAVAAVMAATMGAVAIGIGYSSSHAVRMLQYPGETPPGTLWISAPGTDDGTWAKVKAEAERLMPGAALVPGPLALDAKGRELRLTVQQVPKGCGKCPVTIRDLPAGDDRLLAFLQGRRDPVAAAALASGKAVVFDPRLMRGDKVEVSAWRSTGGEAAARFTVPAVLATAGDPSQGGGVLPASAVTAAGIRTAERRLFADRTERQLTGAMYALSEKVSLHATTNHEQELLLTLSAALALAVVVVLGGTFAATGLAVADMRRDLDTLSAVGGRPLTRRLVVASQAGYVAGLGALTGLPGGLLVGLALSWPTGGTTRWTGLSGFDVVFVSGSVPWLYLAALVVGVPALAALLAGLCARTRLVLARRVT